MNTQREVQSLLSEARTAAENGDWDVVRRASSALLGYDPGNEDAKALLRTARQMQNPESPEPDSSSSVPYTPRQPRSSTTSKIPKTLLAGLILMVVGVALWVRMEQVLDDYADQRGSAGGLGGVVIDIGDFFDTSVDVGQEVQTRRNLRSAGIVMVVGGAALSLYGVWRRSSRG